MKNVAIILAGGVGSRVGYSIPKQFLKVAGKTVIEHTVDVFDNNDLIDEVAVVIHPHRICGETPGSQPGRSAGGHTY